MPELGSIQPKSPNINMITPSAISAGIVDKIVKGEAPVEWKPFLPVMTTRGAIGLGLDILLSPSTYISFGATAPMRLTSKVGAKSIFRKGAEELGAKSVARYAGRTLLTDKE